MFNEFIYSLFLKYEFISAIFLAISVSKPDTFELDIYNNVASKNGKPVGAHNFYNALNCLQLFGLIRPNFKEEATDPTRRVSYNLTRKGYDMCFIMHLFLAK
jgi:hypothetical protein